jgi:hypothetical protein
MVREAKRKDLEYKRHATGEFAKFLIVFDLLNLFESVQDTIEEGLDELTEEDDGDLQMKPMYSPLCQI